MERPQKGHVQWVVHSVAYFLWLVKNLKYTRPHGSNLFLALAATSLSCNTVSRHDPVAPPISVQQQKLGTLHRTAMRMC